MFNEFEYICLMSLIRSGSRSKLNLFGSTPLVHTFCRGILIKNKCKFIQPALEQRMVICETVLPCCIHNNENFIIQKYQGFESQHILDLG